MKKSKYDENFLLKALDSLHTDTEFQFDYLVSLLDITFKVFNLIKMVPRHLVLFRPLFAQKYHTASKSAILNFIKISFLVLLTSSNLILWAEPRPQQIFPK